MLNILLASLAHGLFKVVQLDPAYRDLWVPLVGKQLGLTIQDNLVHVQFCFADEALTIRVVDSLNLLDDQLDCYLLISPSALPKLADSSQLTALIRAEQLDVQGDLHVAQAVSQLLKGLNIDWQVHLSQTLGDVPAQLIIDALSQTKILVDRTLSQGKDFWLDALIEEKRILPSPLEMNAFVEQNRALQVATDKLTERLEQLVKKVS